MERILPTVRNTTKHIAEPFVCPGIQYFCNTKIDCTETGKHTVATAIIYIRYRIIPRRFNRAEIVLGDKWRSPGAGIIESVEPDYDADGNLLRSGTISLKLQDGEIGAVAVDDICMGYFHDYETQFRHL